MSVISGGGPGATNYQGTDQVYYYQSMRPEFWGQSSLIMDKPIKKGSRWKPCTCIMSTLFIILIILIVGAIVLFFTLGSLLGPTTLPVSEDGQVQIIKPKKVSTHTDTVTAEWLKSIMEIGRPKLCMLDIAYLADNYTELYRENHIPTALHFDLNSVKNDSRIHLNGPVHPWIFEDYLQSLGVDKSCHVILYNHGESDKSIMSVTFAFWLFKVYGFQKVSVLTDGLAGWIERNYETSNDTVTIEKRGNFKSAWDSDSVASYSDVLENFETSKFLVVDTRPRSYFESKKKSKYAKSLGRIKGSLNLPYTELLQPNGRLKPLSEFRGLLLKYGITGHKPVIASCETGFSASVLYFVLKSANVPVILYSGSWVEWSHLAPADLIEN